MELKTIIGPDVKTALRLVREQLGDDAMIVSNRRVGNHVEIVVTLDSDPQPQALVGGGVGPGPAPEPAREHAARAQAITAEPRWSRPVAAPAGAVEAAPTPAQLLQMQTELRDMRSFLEERLAEIRVERAAYGPGIEGRIWRRLTRIGIPNGLVRDVVADIDTESGWSSAWRTAIAQLADGLDCVGDLLADGGSFAFVGPTGAGKTTTICKLAVRHVLAHGAAGLALVSMDGERLGGCDMLRAVARLLDVPFHEVGADESLEEVLRRLRDRSLVLVDTAGINRKFRCHLDQLQMLGALQGRLSTVMVLPANAQLSYLQGACADYRSAAPVGVIVTKLDETASLGEVIGVLTREKLALAYTTDGQEIPDDIQVAVAERLVAHAVMLDPEDGAGETHPEPAAELRQGFVASPGIAARIA